MPTAFLYPPQPLVRRHGPVGYRDYASYRPWLRDEFTFRCAYCLIREQWGRVSGEFDLDHFLPQRLDRGRLTEYDNLVYSCSVCNLRKGGRDIPDPATTLVASDVRVYPDGRLVGLTEDSHRIIRVLCLNSSESRRWRRTWIRIIELAADCDPDLFTELMCYPDDLPDLRSCRPPENLQSAGLEDSFLARRERGELPDVYLT